MQYLGFQITCDGEPVSDEHEGALVAGTVGLRNAWKQSPGQFCADWDDELAKKLSRSGGQVWSPVLAGLSYRVELAAIDPEDIGEEPDPDELEDGGLDDYEANTDSAHIPSRISSSNAWVVPAVDLISQHAFRAAARGDALVFEGLPFEHFRTIADDPRVGSVTEGAPAAQAMALTPGVLEVDGIVHRERGLIPTACVIDVSPRTAVEWGWTDSDWEANDGISPEDLSLELLEYDGVVDVLDPGDGTLEIVLDGSQDAPELDDALADSEWEATSSSNKSWKIRPITGSRVAAEGVSAPLQCMECGKKFKRKVTPTSTPKCPDCGSYDIDADYDDEGSGVFFASAAFAGSSDPVVDRVAPGRYLVSWLNDVELAGRHDHG